MANPKEVLERSKTVAVVGMSTHPGKPSHDVPRQLKERGFRVIPVHPSADEILGERAFRSVTEIGEPVDVVDVFRPSEEAPGVARDAAEAGAGAVWLQLGIESDEARAIAEGAGLDYVENRCMGAESARLGITKHADHGEPRDGASKT